MQPVYLLIGVPSSGKSWVANQLVDRFNYIPADNFIKNKIGYFSSIKRAVNGDKPVLAETGFGVSEVSDFLEAWGIEVIPIYIVDKEEVLVDRYFKRSGQVIPRAHLKRQQTYLDRAVTNGSAFGTSSEILIHLSTVTKK